VSVNSSDGAAVFHRAALIGTGMIGGSIGIALREKGLVKHLCGFDRNAEILARAAASGAIDETAGSLEEALEEADLVILAVPVLATIDLLPEVIPHLKAGAIITDVGSTKGPLMAAVESMIPSSIFFIGGHPMAGSEVSGIDGADPALLENAIYVLTPGPGTPPDIIEKLSLVLRLIGAQPLILDPLLHDRAVAMVSHLPHVIAAALVQSVAGVSDTELVRTLAAGGFRDSTRIALGDPEVWRDICISNRWALLAALKQYKKSLDALEKYLSEPDKEAIEEFLLQARDYRSTIPYRGRGILPELFEAVVLVRDEPGVLACITGLLGKAGINIDAIEILHVRELDGGSIRLGFKSREVQKKALALLGDNGYQAYEKNA